MGLISPQFEQKAAGWLRQGISPQRLALTLALGFVLGCVPIIGIPTLACTALALALGLNMPAIQVANYAAMPLQLILIVPFVKLGTRVLTLGFLPTIRSTATTQSPIVHFAMRAGSMAGLAFVGWLLVALPAAGLITLALTPALKRVPALKDQI